MESENISVGGTIIVGIIVFFIFLVIASNIPGNFVYNENEALKAQSRREIQISKESYKGFIEEITGAIFFGLENAIPFFFGILFFGILFKFLENPQDFF